MGPSRGHIVPSGSAQACQALRSYVWVWFGCKKVASAAAFATTPSVSQVQKSQRAREGEREKLRAAHNTPDRAGPRLGKVPKDSTLGRAGAILEIETQRRQPKAFIRFG